jgi:hypothetical protein
MFLKGRKKKELVGKKMEKQNSVLMFSAVRPKRKRKKEKELLRKTALRAGALRPLK